MTPTHFPTARDRDGITNPMPPAEHPSPFTPEAHAIRMRMIAEAQGRNEVAWRNLTARPLEPIRSVK